MDIDREKLLAMRTTADLIQWSRLGIPHDQEEYAQRISRETTPQSVDFLRKALLVNMGVRRRKPTSDNLIILSCLSMFGQAMQVRAYLWLLDMLGVDYTYLPEREYCCGWGLVEGYKGEERAKGYEISKHFIGLNIEQARKVGAKRMFHFCVWCHTAAQCAFPDEKTDIPQRYHLDLVVEALEKNSVNLRLEPTRVAYYEGCHNRNERLAPGVHFDWPAYRKLLDRVEGLEVIDLPHRSCCLVPSVSERLVVQAIEAGAKELITPCPACWTWLEKVGRKKGLPIKMNHELLLEAVGVVDKYTHQWRYGGVIKP